MAYMSSYRRYNYRAYPTQGQCHESSRLYGACRYAYNWVIDQRELMRTRRGKMQTYVQLSGMFTRLKHDPGMEWLQDMSSTPLQQSIRRADTAYRNFFRLYPEPLHEACGIDMGLDSLMSIVYTDGSREKIPHPRTLRKHARKLRKLDKQLARQKKDSKNHAKTRLLRAKAYSRVKNQRRDMAFKLASKVAGENQAVALETLNVKGLARTRLAKSLLDANWTRIIDRIRELAAQYGRTVKHIDRWYPSSQICSICGHRDGRKPLGVREWECPECGAFLDRDWNAALNILDAAGLAESLNAREGDVRRRLACTGLNANAATPQAGTHRTSSLH